MKIPVLTVVLLTVATITAEAVLEREGDQKPDFDELRLEEHLGDDVEVDPHSHESLVRIARQMGVVVTTEPSVHTAKALPKPRLDPKDWESASFSSKESKQSDKVSERLELGPRKLNFAAAAVTTTTPDIDKRIGELLPEDYSNEGTGKKIFAASAYLDSMRTRIGKLRSVDFPKAEFRADSPASAASHEAAHVVGLERRSESDPLRARDWSIPSSDVPSKKRSSQSGKPNRKTHADKKGNDKHQKTKLASTQTSPTTSTSTTTTTTSTTTAPSTSAPKSNPSPSSIVGSSSIDKHESSEGSLTESQLEASDNDDSADDADNDEVLMNEKTEKILEQLAALNLYHQQQQQQQQLEKPDKHMPSEVAADEDLGRLPLTDEETSSEQDAEIARDHQLIKGISSSEDSTVPVTTEAIPSPEEEVSHQKISKRPQSKPEVRPQPTKPTSHRDKSNSLYTKSAKKPFHQTDEETTQTFDRPVSQLVYHREVKRKPPKQMTGGSSSKSSPSKASSKGSTTTSTSSTTPEPTTAATQPSAGAISASLEDFDPDFQQADNGSFHSTTEVPTTPVTFPETSTARSQKRKTTSKKPSNGKEASGGGSATIEPQLSPNTSFVASASHQTPQIVLPPPPQLNPLAALGNLIPLLQLLNRPAPAFNTVPPTVVNKDAVKKPPVKAQITPQRQYQVPYYQVPAQYHLVNSVPFYGYQTPPRRGNGTAQAAAALSAPSKSKLKEKLTPQKQKIPSDAQTSKAQKKKKKKPPSQQTQAALIQTPNISTTIRSMMHFLNSNNFIPTAQAPKRPRTPKGLDLSSSDPSNGSQSMIERDERPDDQPAVELGYEMPEAANSTQSLDGTGDTNTAHSNNNADHNNSTRNLASLEEPLAETPDPVPDASLEVPVEKLAAAEATARDADSSAVTTNATGETVEAVSGKELFDGALDSSRGVEEEEGDSEPPPRMERRMDLEPFSFNFDHNSARDEEALGRALVGGANYKMILGLLTGAFGKRRDARSSVRSDASADLEEKRQIANDLIMQSILYNPPPMYHRAPSHAWPVLSNPPTFGTPAPANRVPSLNPAGRPAFYGKQFMTRPRQPRYFLIDGDREQIPHEILVDEHGRSIRGGNEFLDNKFPTIPLEREPTPNSIQLDPASSFEPLGRSVEKRISLDDNTDSPTNESTSPSPLSFPDSQPPLRPSSTPFESMRPTESAPSSELETTSPSSFAISSTMPAFRIVVPLPITTTTAPPPVIRFSNRIGDRKVKRSAELPGPRPETRASGADTERRPPALMEPGSPQPPSFFRLAGEVRKNFSDSLILRRISTSPKQALLHADDLRPIHTNHFPQPTTYPPHDTTLLDPEKERQKNRRTTNGYPAGTESDPNDNSGGRNDRENGTEDTEASGVQLTSSAGNTANHISVPITVAAGNSSYDGIKRCFTQNATFSQKLSCNDQQFSCESSSVEDLDSFAGRGNELRCSCEDECVHYGDCCWDKVSQLQKEHGSLSAIEYSRERLTWLHCVRTEPDSAYFMVAQCPPPIGDDETSSGLNALCSSSANAAEEDPLLRVAVTSRKSLVTYKNIFCARCHDDSDDVQFWRVELVCPKDRIDIERADRALSECPFITMPPKNLFPHGNEFTIRRQFARRCNPYIDYTDSTKLNCQVISADGTSTIEAPNAEVADKLSIMCDLIYLPTLNLNASGCEKLFYRNRFCALCKRQRPHDLSCPLDAEMPDVPDPRLPPNEIGVIRFPLEIPSTDDKHLCENDSQVFDPWRSACRHVDVGIGPTRRCLAAPASSLPATFGVLQARVPLMEISLAFLIATFFLTLLHSDRVGSSARFPMDSRKTYIGEITICLVSAVLGSQFLLYVALASTRCFTGILCFLLGFGFHFCTTASLAWSNVFLREVRNRLQSGPVLRRKASNTFAGYLLYTLVFSSLNLCCALPLLLWKPENSSINDCSGCGSLCFLPSSSTTGWYTLAPAVLYAVLANFAEFLSILLLWRSQSEGTMLRCVARLEFRNVVLAVLLANLVAPTILLGLVANKLDSERVWFGFLFCYACHGPFIFLFGGLPRRIVRIWKSGSSSSKGTHRASSNTAHTCYHGISPSRECRS